MKGKMKCIAAVNSFANNGNYSYDGVKVYCWNIISANTSLGLLAPYCIHRVTTDLGD